MTPEQLQKANDITVKIKAFNAKKEHFERAKDCMITRFFNETQFIRFTDKRKGGGIISVNLSELKNKDLGFAKPSSMAFSDVVSFMEAERIYQEMINHEMQTLIASVCRRIDEVVKTYEVELSII